MADPCTKPDIEDLILELLGTLPADSFRHVSVEGTHLIDGQTENEIDLSVYVSRVGVGGLFALANGLQALMDRLDRGEVCVRRVMPDE